MALTLSQLLCKFASMSHLNFPPSLETVSDHSLLNSDYFAAMGNKYNCLCLLASTEFTVRVIYNCTLRHVPTSPLVGDLHSHLTVHKHFSTSDVLPFLQRRPTSHSSVAEETLASCLREERTHEQDRAICFHVWKATRLSSCYSV